MEQLEIDNVIRLEEEEATRIIEEARKQAEDIVKGAREEAMRIIEEAHLKGQKEEEALREKAVREIQEEAERLLEEGLKKVGEFRQRAIQSVERARSLAVDLILGKK